MVLDFLMSIFQQCRNFFFSRNAVSLTPSSPLKRRGKQEWKRCLEAPSALSREMSRDKAQRQSPSPHRPTAVAIHLLSLPSPRAQLGVSALRGDGCPGLASV